MKLFIILFGVFMVTVAGIMAANPKLITDNMLRFAESVWLHVLAAAIRIVLGTALILYAEHSSFPLTLHIIGWIAIVAGVIIALVPHAKFTRLIHWAFNRFARYTRIAAMFGALFGGFLIYAVL